LGNQPKLAENDGCHKKAQRCEYSAGAQRQIRVTSDESFGIVAERLYFASS
jgi:hypothetical protein